MFSKANRRVWNYERETRSRNPQRKFQFFLSLTLLAAWLISASKPRPSLCDGRRLSSKSIVYLVQLKHSSYTFQGSAFEKFETGFESLIRHYQHVSSADILIFHEGALKRKDSLNQNIQTAIRANAMNVRLCDLRNSKALWGRPRECANSTMKTRYNQSDVVLCFSEGYLNMIRFYAVSLWSFAKSEGYEYITRMDDDSTIHSDIKYDFFDVLNEKGKVYGFRQAVTLLKDANFDEQLDINELRERSPKGVFPETIPWAAYNNFFVASVSAFVQPDAEDMRRAFDSSCVIYTNRLNDLVFHGLVVHQLYATEVIQYHDFAYEHASVDAEASVCCGGISLGVSEPTVQFLTSLSSPSIKQFLRGSEKLVGKSCRVYDSNESDYSVYHESCSNMCVFGFQP